MTEENQNDDTSKKDQVPAEEAKDDASEKKAAPVEEAKAPKEADSAASEEAPAKKKVAKKVAAAKKGEKAEEGEAKEKGEEDGEEPKRPSAPTAEDLLKDDTSNIKIRRAKGSKNILAGIVHVLATFNNTKVTFSDKQGNVISWSSAGKCNFRGSRKSTAYAAQVVTQDAGRRAMSHGLKEVEVRLKGPGMGRDSAVRALQGLGLQVTSIIDVTPVPHNGCRPPKRRRV